jgi:hypothetical protein
MHANEPAGILLVAVIVIGKQATKQVRLIVGVSLLQVIADIIAFRRRPSLHRL